MMRGHASKRNRCKTYLNVSRSRADSVTFLKRLGRAALGNGAAAAAMMEMLSVPAHADGEVGQEDVKKKMVYRGISMPNWRLRFENQAGAPGNYARRKKSVCVRDEDITALACSEPHGFLSEAS
jgi:hypothetical protein